MPPTAIADDSAPRHSLLDLPSHAKRDLLLLVLLADTPIPQVQEQFGTYHDIFTSLFARGIDLASSEGAPPTDSGYREENGGNSAKSSDVGQYKLRVESYNAVGEHLPSEDRVKQADAILITGSASNAHDDLPWINNLISFVAQIHTFNPSLKLFGICFGHQIISRVSGGVCERSPKGWEIGTRKLKLTERGKEVFPGKGDRIGVHQMHRDHIREVPEGYELIASSINCAVHGLVKFVDPTASEFSLKNISTLTLQGHPEFNATIVNTLIDVREASGVLSQEVGDASREYTGEHDDGNWIARRFLGVLDV